LEVVFCQGVGSLGFKELGEELEDVRHEFCKSGEGDVGGGTFDALGEDGEQDGDDVLFQEVHLFWGCCADVANIRIRSRRGTV
jgi:hypothetical protein